VDSQKYRATIAVAYALTGVGSASRERHNEAAENIRWRALPDEMEFR
jgi:hypothetical protein